MILIKVYLEINQGKKGAKGQMLLGDDSHLARFNWSVSKYSM